MKKDRHSTILLILVFMVGLSLLLYPILSDYWNSFHQSKAIVDYDATVSGLNAEAYTSLLAEADEYNSKLNRISCPLMNYNKLDGYEKILDVSGTGIIGYISIKKINVELPIYHGTSEAILNVAAGHIQGTSLPVGGDNTHAVLSAHRGLPSAKLFTHLDKLEIGDTFTITVLDRLLTYEVDQIRIVEPDIVEDLYVTEGMDYCTLLTCTPYGINSHRLLVRGHRVENSADSLNLLVTADAIRIDPIIVAPLIVAPIIFMIMVWLLIKYREK